VASCTCSQILWGNARGQPATISVLPVAGRPSPRTADIEIGAGGCVAQLRPCTVSGFSRRAVPRPRNRQVVAVQVTKLEAAISGRKCFMICTWAGGRSRPAGPPGPAGRKGQNVRCSGLAIRDRPRTPGEASIWRLIRKAAARNDGTSRSRAVQAGSMTGPRCPRPRGRLRAVQEGSAFAASVRRGSSVSGATRLWSLRPGRQRYSSPMRTMML